MRRFPRVRFVWIMGADILEQLPRWRRWTDIVRRLAFVVLPRPGYSHRALAGQAAHRLRAERRRSAGSAIAAGSRAGMGVSAGATERRIRHRNPPSRQRNRAITKPPKLSPSPARHKPAPRKTAVKPKLPEAAAVPGSPRKKTIAAGPKKTAAPRVKKGQGGTVGAGPPAGRDRDQPGRRQGRERRHDGPRGQGDVLRPDGDRLGPGGPADQRDGAASERETERRRPEAGAGRRRGRIRLGPDRCWRHRGSSVQARGSDACTRWRRCGARIWTRRYRPASVWPKGYRISAWFGVEFPIRTLSVARLCCLGLLAVLLSCRSGWPRQNAHGN